MLQRLALAVVLLSTLASEARQDTVGRPAILYYSVAKFPLNLQPLGTLVVVEETPTYWNVRGWSTRGGEIHGGASKVSGNMALIVRTPAFQGQAGAHHFFAGRLVPPHGWVAFDYVTGLFYLGKWIWK